MNETPELAWKPVGGMDLDARATFISRTYYHLLGAMGLFTALEIFLFQSGAAESVAKAMLNMHWGIVLGAFILVSWIARGIAHQTESLPLQYLALFGFVVAEALVFVPILFIANYHAPGAIKSAAVVTLAGFVGLTAIGHFTRKDFSFLHGLLLWGGWLALAAVAGGLFLGFNLGLWFSVGMVALAGGSILYDTSNVIHYYPENRYVAAALELFADVALMFWYVLRIFLRER